MSNHFTNLSKLKQSCGQYPKCDYDKQFSLKKLQNISYKANVLIKDTIVLECLLGINGTDIVVLNTKEYFNTFINSYNISKILNNRFSIFNRYGINEFLRSIGLRNKLDVLQLTHGVSLSDCLWVRFDEEPLNWKDVSPYNTEYKLDIQWLMDTINPTLSRIIPNYSTNGNFPKCWCTIDDEYCLIKCGTSGAYNAGMEPISEILFTQIAKFIGYENIVEYYPYFVDYTGSDFYYKQPGLLRETVEENKMRLASMCKCFTSEEMSLTTAADLGLTSYEECLEFAERYTDNPYDLVLMLLCDCIGFNKDRHFGNIGFLYNPNIMIISKVAPMYDNNLSLLCYWEDRVNLDDYVNQLRAKDGRTFKELYQMITSRYPIVKDIMCELQINLELNSIDRNRIDILNQIVNKQIKFLIK